MKNCDYLLKVIKPKISIGEKNIDELITWLKKRFDIRMLSENDVTSGQLSIVKKNARAYASRKIGLKADIPLLIDIVEIEENEKSADYYKEGEGDFTQNLVIYFERNANYFFVIRSNRLFSELCIERGISKYDYDNNTSDLMEYLSHYKDLFDM